MSLARIQKGDTVQVISGRERGKTGTVLRLLTERGRAVVEHLNLVKRHTKPRRQGEQGGILEKEAPLALSILLPFCPKCNKGVRLKTKRNSGEKGERICARCGKVLEKAAAGKGKKKG